MPSGCSEGQYPSSSFLVVNFNCPTDGKVYDQFNTTLIHGRGELDSPQLFEVAAEMFIANPSVTGPKVLAVGASDRVTTPVPGIELGSRLGPRRFPADKWLLSSATQKLIRRGEAERAVRTALALHDLDPDYLPRRLPIIAFEDVGVGDLGVCFDTLHVLGKQRFAAATSERDRRRVLVNLVGRLARSVKSRTGCDIFCLAHADQSASAAAAKFARSSERCLVAMASDRGAAVTSRALALHVLTGMSVREGRWPRTVSRFNARGLRAVAERLELSELVAWMLIEGRNTSGLAAMLPLVLEVIAETQPLRVMRLDLEQMPAEKSVLGIPAYAADMYTRTGKAAIAEFTRTIRERHPRFFEGLPDARRLARLVGMALFHSEGSKLDRWLESRAIAEYRNQIEEVELHAFGWPKSESRHRLYQLLEAESRLLWRIRQSHLRASYGNSRRGA